MNGTCSALIPKDGEVPVSSYYKYISNPKWVKERVYAKKYKLFKLIKNTELVKQWDVRNTLYPGRFKKMYQKKGEGILYGILVN